MNGYMKTWNISMCIVSQRQEMHYATLPMASLHPLLDLHHTNNTHTHHIVFNIHFIDMHFVCVHCYYNFGFVISNCSKEWVVTFLQQIYNWFSKPTLWCQIDFGALGKWWIWNFGNSCKSLNLVNESKCLKKWLNRHQVVKLVVSIKKLI